MNDIRIEVDSRYRVNRKALRIALDEFLKNQGITSNCELSVAIVGDRKMRELNRTHRGLDKTSNVLSFSQTERRKDEATPFVASPDHVIRLGDIIISYPEAVKYAVENELMVVDSLRDLAQHGLLHLLGVHHEE